MTARLKAEWLRCPLGTREAMAETFASLRANGCTVTYLDKSSGWFSDTYYNLTIVGPDLVVLKFKAWLEGLMS